MARTWCMSWFSFFEEIQSPEPNVVYICLEGVTKTTLHPEAVFPPLARAKFLREMREAAREGMSPCAWLIVRPPAREGPLP